MSHHDIADRLTRHDGVGPFLHVLAASPSDAYDLGRRLEGRAVARVVRGSHCRTTTALFDECAAAWQFPPYFGENWNALEECLADLDWLPPGGRVLILTDAVQLLADDPPDALGLLVGLISTIASERSNPGGSGTRPGSFHAVLQAEPADVSALEARLTKVGATFHLLSDRP